VSDRDHISVDDLVSLEEARDAQNRMVSFPNVTIATTISISSDRVEAAWRVASITFNNEPLFEATRFLKRSHDNFYVYPGEIPEVISDPGMSALTSYDQTRFEDALQNAFKAVEAIIGDLPKDDSKFFQRLRQIGVNPHEKVGFGKKRPLHQAIRDMNRARDKKAAHGSTRSRTIYVLELLDFQACSEHVVTTAIETTRGSTIWG